MLMGESLKVDDTGKSLKLLGLRRRVLGWAVTLAGLLKTTRGTARRWLEIL